ncbi:hypothetical protein [Petroclostridium sp. X23]|uniref:hypothetical protein n=1 Tax=Petroclostridium sp. X23 TaxID=3045146 RepID=UPI0024AE21FC|nr:hypothetical protein [Petroclostridium sp. X23]WHH56912.1 hypothetical protein QKW49_13735 [Petroclostridium sp. X23]
MDQHKIKKALESCLDLEMPRPCGANDKRICKSIRNGELQESVLDETIRRMLELILKAVDNQDRQSYDKVDHHKLARKIAAKSMVLVIDFHKI